MRRSLVLVMALLWTQSPACTAAAFTNAGAGFAGMSYSGGAWGDYDGDGWLDLAMGGSLTNSAVTRVCRNTEAGFADGAAFPGLHSGGLGWCDYDNDGWLDLWLTGTDGYTGRTYVFRNGQGVFSNAQVSLTPALASAAAWGDYDSDGRQDVALIGYSTNGLLGELWRNTADGFVRVPVGFAAVYDGAVAWGEFDNDGKPDLVLMGRKNPSESVTELWRNTGSGFTRVATDFPAMHLGVIACADYDNDGWTDLLLSGWSRTNALTQLWRNTGAGFAKVETSLPNLSWGGACWGDWNNDGRLDLLLGGKFGALEVRTDVWENTGSGFTNAAAGLPGFRNGAALWGDANNDGALDLFLTGYTAMAGAGSMAQVWLNASGATNRLPTPPSGLVAEVLENGVTLRWSEGTDAETPSLGLKYAVRVGTRPGAMDVVSPHATASGRRLTPTFGNSYRDVSGRPFLALTNLTAGRYFWSVQTIDSTLAGSPFAAEAPFSIGSVELEIALLPDGRVRLAGAGTPGAAWTVLASTNFAEWVTNGSVSCGMDGTFAFTNAVQEAGMFFRVSGQ